MSQQFSMNDARGSSRAEELSVTVLRVPEFSGADAPGTAGVECAVFSSVIYCVKEVMSSTEDVSIRANMSRTLATLDNLELSKNVCCNTMAEIASISVRIV